MAMKKKFPPFSPPASKSKGEAADTARKTKEAQAINMAKIKAKKSNTAETKRKTAEAISVLGKKKAPSSYALGLLDSQKKKKAKQKGM
jgi:hypothetical protein